MSVNKVYIIDAATGETVDAELHDDLSAAVLLDLEDSWAPTRQALRSRLLAQGVLRENWPESLHWNWGNKSLQLVLHDVDDFRVMAVRRQMVWEGGMVTLCKNHFASAASETGKALLYVDYLEAAPWNWTVEKIQTGRFKAVGAILLRAAIEQSYGLGWDGRIGLHALPQATAFYERQGLQFVRNDPDKQNLSYFELSSAEALTRTGRK